jgi:hypothetical protein
MAQQTINIGTAPNDGTGTPLRTSFDYCNLNFTELYTAVGPSGNNIVVPGTATITGNLTVDTNTVIVDAANNIIGFGVTPSVGRGVIQLSAGVGFPATQVASSDANTLDDYEEGTWTPTIIGSTTAGSATYSTQAGNYTKIGRLVTVQMYIGWTGHTGTGDMSISGLPFTSINTISVASAAIGLSDSISLTAGNILAGYVVPNATEVLFKQFPTGGGGSSNVPVDAAGSVMLTVSYIANA